MQRVLHWAKQGNGRAPLILILVIGVAVSVVAFAVVRNWDRQRRRVAFERAAENRYAALNREIESDIDTLVSLKALYLTFPNITRSDFGSFAGPFLSRYLSIQALEWIPRIPDSERASCEAAARQDGLPGFEIVERDTTGKLGRARQRDEYYPVYFVEPFKGNETALGYDLASNPTRKEALDRARDTGELVATARIRLVQETAGQFGFLLFAPVYRKDAPAVTVAERRANLLGFALGVFRIGDILEESLSYLAPEGINIALYDQSAPPEERFLYSHISRLHDNSISSHTEEAKTPVAGLEYAKTLDLAGRKWLVACTPFRCQGAAIRSWQSCVALSCGLLLTGLLLSYVAMHIRRTQEIERLVAVRTDELQQANERLEREGAVRARAEEATRKSEERFRSLVLNLSDVITIVAPDGTITYESPSLERMVGYRAEELVGRNAFDLVHPDDLAEVRASSRALRRAHPGAGEGTNRRAAVSP